LRTVTGNNGGRYYVVDEGKDIKLPSVTTILGKMQDKSGLDAWVAKVGEQKAKEISTFAANRGTFMHSLHEHYLESKFINPVEKPLQEAFKLAMAECNTLTKEELECGKDLFMQFHNNSDFYDRISEVMFQEIPLWSLKGGGYAGRMDLSIWGKPRIPKVIDFKTSRRPKKEEWIDGYKMQTAAYSVALHEQHGIFPESTEIWISCETGEVQMFEMDRSQIKYYFEKFHDMVVEYHKLYN
jgi:hypothetical protein